MSGKSALHITLARLGGLLIFLILLVIANILWINNSIYLGIVGFLNTKLFQIIVFSILLYLGELFFVFDFPLNFPAPIFNAFGGVVLVDFIFDIIVLGLNFANMDLTFVMRTLEPVVVVIVFILAIIVGYVKVFGGIGSKHRKKSNRKREVELEDKLLDEIKDTFQDAGENIKKAIHPEKEKPKSKKKVTRKKTSSKKKVKKKA